MPLLLFLFHAFVLDPLKDEIGRLETVRDTIVVGRYLSFATAFLDTIYSLL